MVEKHKTYNAIDFEKYHNGAMSAKEMHELERAALDDPFLADALEGYLNSDSVAADIAELRLRLHEKKKDKKVFSIFILRQNGWWRVAALITIVAGGSYLFYFANYGHKNIHETNLAVTRSKDSVGHTPDFSTSAKTLSDTSSLANIPPAQLAKKNDAGLLIPKPGKRNTASVREMTKESAKPGSSMALKQTIKADSFSNQIAMNSKNVLEEKKYQLKGKVTDESGKPLAFATIKDNNRNRATVTDTTGIFVLHSNDSAVNATVSAAGYNIKEVTLQPNAQPTIAVEKNPAALSEVMVAGYGVKKSKRTTASVSETLDAKVSGTEINHSLVNNENFDDYVKRNLVPIYDKNNLHLTGDVILSFKVNKKGRPKNIKIIKSSCTECEDEAITLLQNGPHWDNANNSIKNVLIRFN